MSTLSGLFFISPLSGFNVMTDILNLLIFGIILSDFTTTSR